MGEPEFDVEQCARQLRNLAHPHRLHIVACLLDGTATAAELAQRMGTDVATVEVHLQYLIDVNLAECDELDSPVGYRLRSEVSLAWLSLGDPGTIDLGCCQLTFTPEPKPDERKRSR
jgi:hypothetical protein